MYKRHMEQKPDNLSTEKEQSLTAQFYTLYAAKLLTYITRHIRAASDAEDVLFEVFLAVIERERELHVLSEDEQRAWLWTVARNKIVDRHRRAQRGEPVPLEHVADMLDDQWLPEQVTLRREERQFLHTSVQHLPPLQQEVLYLRFIAGLRSSEIAAVLQKNEAAIRKQLSRTLMTLRTRFER
jgi:RNA polymerase sigma-70 factor (ECF subfamily)